MTTTKKIRISQDIYSATANMECCSVMITDLALHNDTTSTPSIRLYKAVIVITFSTPKPQPQPTICIPDGNGIRQRIAHYSNVVISNDDTFLPKVGAYQDRSNIRSVDMQPIRALVDLEQLVQFWQRSITNNMAILSWCRNTSLCWTWTVPGGSWLLVSSAKSSDC